MRKVTGKLNNDFGEITSLTVPYDLVVSGSNHYVYLVMDEEEIGRASCRERV